MTADSRLDRDLTALLEDLYLAPSPDYRSEAYATATHRRQRPSWAFAGRWLPMADIAGTAPVVAPPVRWRTIGVALLLIAILLAGLAVVAGSLQRRVPPPFGPARNGLIVYPTGGDIYALDPVTGNSVALVTGDSGDLDGLFSPDGTRLAFSRLSQGQANVQLNVMVADADGTHVAAITATPLAADGLRFEWAPGSRSVYVQTADRQVLLLDATKVAEPRVLATGAELYMGAARPPNGDQILIKRADVMHRLVLLDVKTGHEQPIAEGGADDLGSARWSPDGGQIVYTASAPDDRQSQRLWIINADGTGARQITHADGTWYDIDPSWSPDGRRIAFTRYERTSTDPITWEVRPIAVYDVDTAVTTPVGPTSHDVRTAHPTQHDSNASVGEGFGFDWSPDGTTLLAVPSEATGHAVLIDVSADTWSVLDPLFDEQGGAAQEWQRTAP